MNPLVKCKEGEGTGFVSSPRFCAAALWDGASCSLQGSLGLQKLRAD